MIRQLQESYTLIILCTVLEVNRSSFKYWDKHTSAIKPEEIKLAAKVKAAHTLSEGSAGARTLATMVSSEDAAVSRYRAAKAMKQLDIRSCQPPKPNYKPAKKAHLDIKNHLAREFSPVRPNQVWCGDVTYLWVGTHWLYLAAVLDLYSRKIVGFALSDSPDSALTARALNNAFENRGRPKNLMFHSDQGCHYTSKAFRQQIWRHQIKQSMSRRGNCWDNAPMERFFRSLKTENMPKNGYSDDFTARKKVRDYIHLYYNSVRPHTHNIGLAPVAKEAHFRKCLYLSV